MAESYYIHYVAGYVRNFYLAGFRRGDDFEFRVDRVPENPGEPYTLTDQYGIQFRLYERNTRLVAGQSVHCSFSKLESNFFSLVLSERGVALPLLSADEAETVFHEFGHALNGLFADVHYNGVSGVPRDFVELPSQVMEHWVFEPEVLKVYAKHHETGEVIPQAIVDKMVKSGKYGQGFATTEYVAASLLDMDYHVLKEVTDGFDVESFEAKVMGGRG